MDGRRASRDKREEGRTSSTSRDVHRSAAHRRCAVRTLVVYDSLHGNTEKIARAIGSAVSGEVEVLRVSEAGSALLKPFDLLVVGSPTQNQTATAAILRFVDAIPSPVLKGA